MTQDQLVQARRARWRQDGNALLTLDDAERWLRETPLCLYLPRHSHVPAPAPSFVEAVAGVADPAPGPERLSAAADMLARLVESGAAIALNLFGSPSGIVGEQPDFLATPEALPYLYAMQAERNPKKEPTTTGQARVSPLAAETWKLLEREGALTVAELRAHLGREVTEAATLRALGELWHVMRAVPVPAASGLPAHWELLVARHRRELNVGSTQSQTTALSILASFYLQSAVAASPEQVGIFLSPLASRSRIRDVVHGLTTTRQLHSFPLGGEEQLYIEGTLPEFPEEEAVAAELSSAATGEDAGLEQNEPSVIEAAASGPSAERAAGRPRPAAHSQRGPGKRPSFGDRARGAGGDRARGAGGDRGRSFPRREAGAGRPPRRDGEAGSRPRFEKRDRSPARFDRPAGAGEQGTGERPAASGSSFPRRDRPAGGAAFRSARPGGARPFGARPGGARPGGARPGGPRTGAGPRSSSDRPARPFTRGGAGDRRPSGPPREGRPNAGRPSAGRPSAGRPSAGRPDRGGTGDRPRSPRPFGEKRPYTPSGEKRPFRPAGEKRPYTPSGEKRPFRPAGERGPAAPRPFAARGPRRDFDKPGAAPGDKPRREGGAPRSFADKPFAKKPYVRKPAGPGAPGESGAGERKPYTRRPAGDRKPFAAGKPAGDRKPFGAGRPAGARAPFRERAAGAGRPAFGGGERKPFRKDAGGPGGPPRPFRKPEGAAGRPARPFRKDAGAAGGPPRPFRKDAGAGGAGRPPRPAGSASDRGPRPAGGAGARPFRPAGARPAGARPAGARPGGARPGGARPGGARPGGAGPGARTGRPAGGPGGRPSFRPGGRPTGRPAPGGARKPGGTRPPARKPRREGDEG